MADLLGASLPVVAAPMAGGPSTPALVAAVTGAGGFAFLAAGYKSPRAVQEEVAAVRGCRTFGVNLFVPQRDEQVDPRALAAYADALAAEAAALGVPLVAEPVSDDDGWDEKLAVLRSDPVPVVSLTFGLPPVREISALRRAGSVVLASVTTPVEARAAAAAGVDGLVVQGPRAGGHSATFDPRRPLGSGTTLEVVQAVRATTSLPVIAAGGVDGARAVAELVAAGAEGVAVGTLLLRSDEAGTSPVHRAALSDPRFTETVVTTAFTGRPARALRNHFTDRYGPLAPVGYPAVHHLTRGLRSAAAERLDPDRVHLWAGTGHRSAVTGPAASIVRDLASAL